LPLRLAALHYPRTTVRPTTPQSWQQREAALLQQIEGLQQQLMHLLWHQQQQSAGGGGGAPPRVTLLPDAPPAGALPAPPPLTPGAAHVASALGSVGFSSEADTEPPSPPATPGGSRRERRRARRAEAAAAAAGGAPAGASQGSSPTWADLFVGPDSSVDAAVRGGSGAASDGAGDEAQSAPPLPQHVRELAAAIALVESGDVLTDDLDLAAVRAGRRSGSSSSVAAATPAPAPAPAQAPEQPQSAPPARPPQDGEVALETVRGAPEGPPPLLAPGDDDIYWVAKLHAALEAVGCYAPDEETEDFFFGDGTQGALMSYQACNGLDETGAAAWRARGCCGRSGRGARRWQGSAVLR
jgi:hypothetical protein